MNSSSIELEFADGRYIFALPVPHCEELQRKCGIGIGGLYGRVIAGNVTRVNEETGELELVQIPTQAQFHILDIIEIIRHGLIGGGKGFVNEVEIPVSEALANKLVATYVAGKPIDKFWALAASIMIATIHGYEPPKKDGPAQEPAEPTEEPTAG